MKLGTVAIFGCEPDYGQKLADYLNRHLAFGRTVKQYEETGLKQDLRKNRISLLITERGKEEGLKEYGNIPCLFLTEEPKEREEELYCYQPAYRMVRKIEEMLRCQEKGGGKGAGETVTRCFFSPGSQAIDLLSYEMARLLSEKKKTIFISLKVFSGRELWADLSEGKNLSDLLAAVRGEKGIERLLTDMLVWEDGICLIPPVRWPEDIYETKPKDWKNLFSALVSQGGAQELVILLGTELADSETWLENCDYVYGAEEENPYQEEREKAYERYLTAKGRGDLLEKRVRIPLSLSSSGEKKEIWNRREEMRVILRQVLAKEEGSHEAEKMV